MKEIVPLLWVIATEAYPSDDFCLGNLQSLPCWKLLMLGKFIVRPLKTILYPQFIAGVVE